ncbi:MAG: PfkB family carbohydrate kinase [Candidatus Kariarchaeaceae archaeon]
MFRRLFRFLYPKALLIGHITVDELGEARILEVGGPPNYFLTSLAFLKIDPVIWTYVDPEYPNPNTHSNYIEQLKRFLNPTKCHFYDSDDTTTFIISDADKEGKRNFKILAKADNYPDTVPVEMQNDWDFILVSPVINEVPLKLLKELQTLTEFLLVDIQGFLRYEKSKGEITRRIDSDLLEGLKDCQVIKFSLREAEFLCNELSDKELDEEITQYDMLKILRTFFPEPILIITSGDDGAYVLEKSSCWHVPAPVNAKFVDETGAGDVFLAAIAASCARGKTLIDSVAIGCAISSLSVSFRGAFWTIEESICQRLYQEALDGTTKIA